MMMAIEGPFLAAMIARLAEPVYNLAAHGVAFAVAIILEAPVIMMLGAATALVDGRVSFLRLRRFTAALKGGGDYHLELGLIGGGWPWFDIRCYIDLPAIHGGAPLGRHTNIGNSARRVGPVNGDSPL